LLPEDLQQVIARMVNVSQHNTKAVLNVAFPYTSRHEVVDAVKVIADGVQAGKLQQQDITEDLIDRCMYSGDDLIPDMMVRTSGEVRLSDFLLWQSGYTCLVFRETLWPEFTFWDLFMCLMTYQRNHGKIQLARAESGAYRERLHRAAQLAAAASSDGGGCRGGGGGGGVGSGGERCGTRGDGSSSSSICGSSDGSRGSSSISAGGCGSAEDKAAREARVDAFIREIRASRNSIYARMDPDNAANAANVGNRSKAATVSQAGADVGVGTGTAPAL